MCSSKADCLPKVLLKCSLITSRQVWSSRKTHLAGFSGPWIFIQALHYQPRHSLDCYSSTQRWAEKISQYISFIQSANISWLPIHSQLQIPRLQSRISQEPPSWGTLTYSSWKSRYETDTDDTMWKILSLDTEENMLILPRRVRKAFSWEITSGQVLIKEQSLSSRMGGGCVKGCKDIPGRASSRPGVESCKGLVIVKERWEDSWSERSGSGRKTVRRYG